MLTRHKDRVDVWLRPAARRLADWGVSPTAITLAIPVLVSAACWWFVRSRDTVSFALLVTLVGLLDALDGAVARVSGRVSRWGAYLDALCDRYVETLVVLAAAVVTGYWLLSLLVLSGSLLTSYAKARAAMEVPVVNQEWPDLLERTERDLLFVLGLALGTLVSWRPLGHDLFWWMLAGLAGLTHGTVAQRMLRAHGFIAARAPRRG